jgi:hypothetical protein
MQKSLVLPASLLAFVFAASNASATDYWVGPPGTGSDRNAGTQAAPFATFGMGARTALAGDTVHIHGGVYSESVVPGHTGTATAWITFEAAPGELPILDGTNNGGTGFSAGGTGFIRVIGIASRRFGSSGFDNGFNDSVGNVQFINCIADNNGINGIAFYKATGVLIQNSIVLHNGNQLPSWSSGVNLFTAGGTFQDNQVIGNVSFENVDISTTHSVPTGHPTDGSGFILDQQSTGALFENNIGFRNGGSCIRLTNSSGAHMINNTCFSDAMDPNDGTPANPAEVFFSDNTITTTNVIVANDLLVMSSNNVGINATKGTGSTFLKNLTNGAAALFTNAAAADFVPAATATTVINQGDATNAPATDIGFDPRCITQTSAAVVGTAISWWGNYLDYTYVSTVGAAACFHPAVRPQGGAPDIGAYEVGGVLSDAGVGGTTGGSSSSSSGGTTSGSSGSSSSSGGTADAGVDAGKAAGSSGGSGGTSCGSGGSTGGSSGASAGSSGGGTGGSSGVSSGSGSGGEADASTPPHEGASGFSGGSNAEGCDVAPGTRGLPSWAPGAVILFATAAARRRRRRSVQRRADSTRSRTSGGT